MKIQRHHFPLLLTLALALSVFWLAYFLQHQGLPYDDAFITLTYARNVAAGRGFVFNGGTPWLGTSAPLLALLLAGLVSFSPRAGALLPLLSLWLGAGLWAVAVWLAFLIGRQLVDDWAGVAMAAMLATVGALAYVIWAEYSLMMALLLGGFYLAMRSRQGWAGVLFGLAFLARGDSVLLAALVGMLLWWQQGRLPWRLIGGFTLVLLLWMLYAMPVLGNPLPATLGVKRAHRFMGAWPHLVVGFYQLMLRSPWFRQLRFLILLGLWGWGCALFWRRRQGWALILLGWAGFYAVAYALLDVPFYFWYVTPLFASLGLSAALVLAVQPRARGRWLVATLMLVLALLGWMDQQRLAVRTARPSAKMAAYVRAGQWLQQHTSQDSTVAAIEVGTIGYYSQRQVLDLLGLVTPGAKAYLRRKDTAGFFQVLAPDYYVRNQAFDTWGMTRQIHEAFYFRAHYSPVATIPQEGQAPIVIYQRQNDGE